MKRVKYELIGGNQNTIISPDLKNSAHSQSRPLVTRANFRRALLSPN